MSFAQLEARLNRAAQARIGNASATWWAGGVSVAAPVAGLRVIFDREANTGHAGGAVLDFEPTASVLAQDAPGLARGDALQVVSDAGDTTPRSYTVLRAEADGTGWVQTYLRDGA